MSSQELVAARHVLACSVDEDDDRRAAARFHSCQHVPRQHDGAVDAERRAPDNADYDRVTLAVDFGDAVHRP